MTKEEILKEFREKFPYTLDLLFEEDKENLEKYVLAKYQAGVEEGREEIKDILFNMRVEIRQRMSPQVATWLEDRIVDQLKSKKEDKR